MPEGWGAVVPPKRRSTMEIYNKRPEGVQEKRKHVFKKTDPRKPPCPSLPSALAPAIPAGGHARDLRSPGGDSVELTRHLRISSLWIVRLPGLSRDASASATRAVWGGGRAQRRRRASGEGGEDFGRDLWAVRLEGSGLSPWFFEWISVRSRTVGH